jgi:hypothetical protein
MMPITTAGMNVVARNLVGRASSLSNVTRQIFASFGIAVLTSIMQNRQIFHYMRLADGISSTSAVTSLNISQIQNALTAAGADQGTAAATALAAIYSVVQKQAMVFAIDNTFIIASIFLFIALPMILFMGNKSKTNTQSA